MRLFITRLNQVGGLIHVRGIDTNNETKFFKLEYFHEYWLRNQPPEKVKEFIIRLSKYKIYKSNINMTNPFNISDHSSDNIDIIYTDRPLSKFIKSIGESDYGLFNSEYTTSLTHIQTKTKLYIYRWVDFEVFPDDDTDINLLTIKPVTEMIDTPKLKLCCYDIENFYNSKTQANYSKNKGDDPIGSIVYHISDESYVFLAWNNTISKPINDVSSSGNHIKIFQSEVEMLKYFIDVVNDCDVVYGYNNYLFDDLCIQKRAKLFGIDGNFKCDSFDQYTFLSLSFTYKNSFTSFKLDCVAKELLTDKICEEMSVEKESKIHLPYRKINKIFNEFVYSDYDLGKLSEIIDYNIQDVKVTETITKVTKGLNEQIFLSGYTGTRMIDTKLKTANAIIPYINRKLTDENMYLWNIHGNKWPYHGAYVDWLGDQLNEVGKKPETYFFSDIYPFDFASLYPNIIRTYNLSPDTYVENIDSVDPNDINIFEVDGKTNKSTTESDPYLINPTSVKTCPEVRRYAFYKSEVKIGYFPKLLGELLTLRSTYKKDLKKLNKDSVEYGYVDNLQLSIKLIANSIYGLFGQNVAGRKNLTNVISFLPVADVTTNRGQHNIKLLQKILNGEILPTEISITDFNPNNMIDGQYRFEEIQIFLKDFSSFLYTDTDSVYNEIRKPINQKSMLSELIDSNPNQFGKVIETYINTIFKKPLQVEFEGHITLMNICKLKAYIFEQYGSVNIKGLVKNTTPKYITEFHKLIFNKVKSKTISTREDIIKESEIYISKVMDDVNKDGDLSLIQSAMKLTYDNVTEDETSNAMKKLKPKLTKKINEDIANEIKQEHIKSICSELGIDEHELGYISSRQQKFYRYKIQECQLEEMEHEQSIQTKGLWDDPILTKIKSLNRIPIVLLDQQLNMNNPDRNFGEKFEVDWEYYKIKLQKYIDTSIYPK